jgi:hypothetical protein
MQPTDIDPGKIELALKWWDWKDSFYNMYCVIREDHGSGWVPPNELEQRAEQLPHTGVTYKKDSDLLWTQLVKCTAGTLAQEWLKDYEQNKDTRAAWKHLLLKCEGKEANNKRVVAATRIVSTDPARGGIYSIPMSTTSVSTGTPQSCNRPILCLRPVEWKLQAT